MSDEPTKARTALASQLKAGRIRHRLTQAELAKQSGYSAADISRWETGERLPSLPQFMRLVSVLRMDMAKTLRLAAEELLATK